MLSDAMVQHRERRKNPAISAYRPPTGVRTIMLGSLLTETGRDGLDEKQLSLLRGPGDQTRGDIPLYFSGDLSLLDRPCVAIVGSRSATAEGLARARRLAKELANSGFVVVSGLAHGVDEAAHTSAIAAGGSTVGVIGTPLDKAYPPENALIQEAIYREHLLVSQFATGERTFKSSFPKRNRVMAALTDATVIIEASDTSGTLHQAAECVRLNRWLFILRSVVEDATLTWPKKFLVKGGKTSALSSTSQLIEAVLADRKR